MAKRKSNLLEGSVSLPPADEASSRTPSPPNDLYITYHSLAKGEVLHRVYMDIYLVDQFNPGVKGNARFSPIRNKQGVPIPTIYAGNTMDCAMMETVFHDVPHTAGFKSLDKSKLDGQMHGTVRTEQDLKLVDLSNVALRKLGVTRKQLIDTEKDQYPDTRKWAEAIHRQCPEAQGLIWVSRQDDTARAVVLFGDRIPGGALLSKDDSRSLLGDANAYDAVLDLADRIGVNILPGIF